MSELSRSSQIFPDLPRSAPAVDDDKEAELFVSGALERWRAAGEPNP